MGGSYSYADLGPQGKNIITQDSYNSFPIHADVSPYRLTFDILREKIELGHIYTINIISSIDPSRKITIIVTQIFTNGLVKTTHINNNPGIAVDYEVKTSSNPKFAISIGSGSIFTLTGVSEDNKYAISGDVYTFLYNKQSEIPYQLQFYRDYTLNTQTPNSVKKSDQKEIILINSQTLIDASDIGNTIFKIIENDKEKIYVKDCIFIVSVLKGKGKTAGEKVENMFLTIEQPLNFYQFGLNILKYTVLRYFLSKLLYGNFDVNYLLGIYYNNFLKHLKNSKYNDYLNLFINPESEFYGYDKYFLYQK